MRGGEGERKGVESCRAEIIQVCRNEFGDEWWDRGWGKGKAYNMDL